MNEEFAMICFQVISNSGSAKSSYIEAIQKAKSGDFNEAEKLMTEGEQFFLEAHRIHAEFIQKEAAGEKIDFSLILMHAEDQMAGTEFAKVMAQEMIELYRKFA